MNMWAKRRIEYGQCACELGALIGVGWCGEWDAHVFVCKCVRFKVLAAM